MSVKYGSVWQHNTEEYKYTVGMCYRHKDVEKYFIVLEGSMRSLFWTEEYLRQCCTEIKKWKT